MSRYTFSYISANSSQIVFEDATTQSKIAVDLDHKRRKFGPEFHWKGRTWPVLDNFAEQLFEVLDDEQRAALMAAFIRGSRHV